MTTNPIITVIGGPNGAGKTTISRDVLHREMGICEFVNADSIAQGLSGFRPELAAIAAGRLMLTRIRELASARTSFAFESTLASRTFAPWLSALRESGYDIHVLYVSLRSPELAIRRVKSRVRKGGHSIPEDVIRRRFGRSAANMLDLYLPIARVWQVYDNSQGIPRLIADKLTIEEATIFDKSKWLRLHEIANEERGNQNDTE